MVMPVPLPVPLPVLVPMANAYVDARSDGEVIATVKRSRGSKRVKTSHLTHAPLFSCE